MARKTYSVEFKDGACRLVAREGYGVVEAARKLGVHVSTLRCWLRRGGHLTAVPEPLTAADADDPQALKVRVRDLEARLRRSEMEKDILKKATAFFAAQST